MGKNDYNQKQNPCDTFLLNQEYDIMNLDELLNILHMKKRILQTKALYPYEIHHTEKSGYFTLVDDDKAPTGKKKSVNVVRKSCGMRLQNGTLTPRTET